MGDLRSVDGECFLLFTGHGAYELDLPAGYQLSPKDGSADVLSPDGGVVAPAGELIGVNGELDKDAQTTCGVPILRSSEVLLFEVDMDAPPCQISMGGDLGDAVRQVEAEVANDNLTAESLLRAADAVDQLALQLSSVDRAHAESLASTLRANASDPDGDALSEALFWYRAEYGVRCGTMVVD